MELHDFLLPELANLRQKHGQREFMNIYNNISLDMTIREVAAEFGKIKSLPIINASHDFLDLLHSYVDTESLIRFFVWPSGYKAPHHFSKCLQTKELKTLFGDRTILALTAILGDPKGLNIRNIAAHGLSIDSGLSRSLMNGIRSVVLPLLPEYKPPTIDFSIFEELLDFFSEKLDLPTELKGIEFAKSTKFPFIKGEREKVLDDAYKYYDECNYVDALLLLFPIFEQSLRLHACETMNLPESRKCADPNEQFLSIKECYESLPKDIARMCNDLLFHPDGPRIRDRIFHEGVKELPKVFAFVIFELFERCCKFSAGIEYGKWEFAFHPARILEHNLYKCCGIRGIDTLPYYSSKTYAILIGNVKESIKARSATFKQKETTDFCNGAFQRLVGVLTLYLIKKEPTEQMIHHYTCIVVAPKKYAALHCAERMWDALCKEAGFLRKTIPFINEKPSIDDIIRYSSKESLDKALRYFLEFNNE